MFGGFCLFHENLQILYARIFLEHKGEISKKDLEEVIQCCRKDIVQAIYLSFLFFCNYKICWNKFIYSTLFYSYSNNWSY